jgi:hypothetical protein
MSRIETDKTILPYLPVSSEERAGNLIEACVARGTARLRTHVDIDLESRLLKLGGARAAPRPCERADRRLSVKRRHALPSTRPVKLKLSSRQADDCLLRCGSRSSSRRSNLRPCRGRNYVPVLGLFPDRTRMVCIWRKISHRERGSGR